MIGRTTAAVLCLALILARAAEARQSTPEAGSQPWTGDAGVTRLVSDIMAADAAKSAEPRVSKLRGARLKLERRGLGNALGAPTSPIWPPSRTPLAAAATGPLLPQTVGSSFLAVQSSESPFIPPDSMGAAGPTQFLVAVNGRIKVFDKTGVLGPLNTDLDTFFAAALPAGSAGTSDPRVRFDRLTDRWFLSAISVDTPNRILLAVSSGPTITSASSFTFFFFQHDLVGTTPNADTGGFADYDTLGLDVNALYVGANIFNAAGTTFIGTSGYVVRKTSILAGGPIIVTAFRQMV